MGPKRQLKVTPSNTDSLGAVQKQLIRDLSDLEAAFLSRREAVASICWGYQASLQDRPEVALEHLARVRSKVSGLHLDAAMRWAGEILKPKETLQDIMSTCILQWRFDKDTFWRGVPDNPRIIRLAKNILTASFRKDSIVASRSFDLSGPGPVVFKLLCGDGSARTVAAGFVWTLLPDTVDNLPVDEDLDNLAISLATVGTLFERHGQGTDREMLVAQAARQNQVQMVLPVSTFEWLRLVVQNSGVEIGVATTKAKTPQALEDLLQAYNHHPEVEAYAEVASLPA